MNDEPPYTNEDGRVACAWHLPVRGTAAHPRWKIVEDAEPVLRCEVCRENEQLIRDGAVPY